jgi:16S rRNA processing protein RimM
LSKPPEFVAIARIVRPQGRRGEVLADILTDFPERFAERRNLWLSAEDGSARRDCILQEYWLHKGRVVLKFSGVESISDAEALTGMLVEISSKDRSQLEQGSVYVSDLVGSVLLDSAAEPARRIGVIEDVRQVAGAAPLLVVRNAGREYEIPFAQEYVKHFDSSEKRIEMKLPEGMLEVNAPLSVTEKGEQHEKK